MVAKNRESAEQDDAQDLAPLPEPAPLVDRFGNPIPPPDNEMARIVDELWPVLEDGMAYLRDR